MNKSRKSASRTKNQFDSPEFGEWLLQDFFKDSKKFSAMLLTLMSKQPKAKRFFTDHKAELENCINNENPFSVELVLKIFDYFDKNRSVTSLGGVHLQLLKANYLASKKPVDIPEEMEEVEEAIEEDPTEELLRKIAKQAELIETLKSEKATLNERLQQSQYVAKELDKAQAKIAELKLTNNELRSDNQTLQQELELAQKAAAKPVQVVEKAQSHEIQALLEQIEMLNSELASRNQIIANFYQATESLHNILAGKAETLAVDEYDLTDNTSEQDSQTEPARNLSKKVRRNANRNSPEAPTNFEPREDDKNFITRRNYVRLPGQPNQRNLRFKLTNPGRVHSQNLLAALNPSEIYSASQLKICLIREKKPVEMTEVVGIFAKGSKYIQPYRENLRVQDFLKEIKKDVYDLFVIFKDSSKHEISESIWWHGLQNAVVFDFHEEKAGENRSKLAGQVKIVQKILAQARQVQY